jgi:hypothetical protein
VRLRGWSLCVRGSTADLVRIEGVGTSNPPVHDVGVRDGLCCGKTLRWPEP